jgi:hypothetical protein
MAGGDHVQRIPRIAVVEDDLSTLEPAPTRASHHFAAVVFGEWGQEPDGH